MVDKISFGTRVLPRRNYEGILMSRDVTVLLIFGSDAAPIKSSKLRELTSYFDGVLASVLEQNPGTDVVRIGMIHSFLNSLIAQFIDSSIH